MYVHCFQSPLFRVKQCRLGIQRYCVCSGWTWSAKPTCRNPNSPRRSVADRVYRVKIQPVTASTHTDTTLLLFLITWYDNSTPYYHYYYFSPPLNLFHLIRQIRVKVR